MTIEERVHNLERSARWWRRTSVVAVAVLAGVLLVGGKGETVEELRVRKLVIVDEKGTAQIVLKTHDGAPHLDVGATAGGVSISVFEGRPGVTLYHKGKSVSNWRVGTIQTFLSLNSLKDGEAAATISTTLDGSMHMLTFVDDQGTTRLSMILGEAASLSLMDKKQQDRIRLETHAGKTAITVCDKTGTDRAVLGVVETENKVTGAKTTTAESTLTLFDAKSDVLWQAPR